MSASASPRPAPARTSGLGHVRLRAPLFVSDLHLCARQAQTVQGFLALLESIAGDGTELVVLGDLFEYWAGDDILDEEQSADDTIGREIAHALGRAAARGTEIYLMHGNRDILLGRQFLQHSGARLLADPAIAVLGEDSGEQATLLAHGDAYCTLDLPYQAFRRQARDAAFQEAFLARPLDQRRALLGQARERSQAGKQQLSMQIMDVAQESIEAALRAAGVRQMIHGHTHRPARHDFLLDGSAATRWVLPDWDLDCEPARGGTLRWTRTGLQTIPLSR